MSDESDQEPLAASAIGDGDHASLALAYGVCALPVANISLPLASGSRVPRQVSLPVLLEFVHIFNQPVCASYRNMICCGIASRVLVYASHNGSFVHSSTVEIANNVTACSFSARGGYLVIGDDKCLAHFVQVGLWECVASIAVSKDESSQINLITHHIRDPEHEDIIFVLTNLRMLRFTNVDFRKLESDAGRTDFCSLSPGSAEGICVRSIDLKAHDQGLIRDIASVLPWRGTFIETFESFLTAGSEHDLAKLQILTLLAAENGKRYAELVSLPSYATSYRFQVAEESWLIQSNSRMKFSSTAVEMFQTDAYIVELVSEKDVIIDLVEELRERSVQGDLNKIMLIWNRHCDLSLLNGLPGILGELSERVPAHAVIRWLKCDVIPKLLSAEQWAQLANWAVRYARIIETAHSKPHIAQSLLLLFSPSLDLAVSETMNSGIKTSLETTATTPASYISKILFGAQKSDMVRVGFNDWEGKNEVLTNVGNESSGNNELCFGQVGQIRYALGTSLQISDSVESTLAEKDSPKIAEITEQYRLMRLKRVLHEHRIVNFNISDFSKSKALLRFILSNIASRVAMKQALQVVAVHPRMSKTEAYVIRMRFLFRGKETKRAISLLLTGILTFREDPDFDWSVDASIALCLALKSVMEEVQSTMSSESDKESSIWPMQPVSILADYGSVGFSLDATIKNLQNIKQLSEEFNVRMSLKTYKNDENARRDSLNTFAKEVFKHGFMASSEHEESPTIEKRTFSKTELYRFAELLGFKPESIDGIIAEESARNGDIRTSLILCKELHEKTCDQSAAYVLRNVAVQLAARVPESCNSNNGEMASTHRYLTRSILDMSRKSVIISDVDSLGDCLDDFKNFEILHEIFNNCDAGYYSTVVAYPDESRIEFSEDLSSSSSMMGNILPHLQQDSAEVDLTQLKDTFASCIFKDRFYEKGLILPTGQTMTLASGHVLDLASEISQDTVVENRGKNKCASSGSIESGQSLAILLRNNRVFSTAFRLWQRIWELKLRGTSLPRHIVTDSDVEMHFSMTKELAETILCSRETDPNLAFGFLLALDMSTAFQVFKTGMSTTGTDYNRLLTFAAIGAGCGLAWNQIGFRADCIQLAKNSKWWHQLALFGIPVETESFRASRMGEYQRALVPDLLKKTGFDIATALEFTRAYNIEDDCAVLEYISLVLQSDILDEDKKCRIAGISDDVTNKEALLRILMDAFKNSSSTNYEKIEFIFSQILRLSSSSTAADVASRMADEFPPGTEKIATATYALSAMEKSLEALGSEDQLEQARRKVESLKYRVKITETEHDLTSANLNEFLDLADRPQKLIEELYRCYSEKGLSGIISESFLFANLRFVKTRMLRSSDEKKLQLQLLYIARSVTVQEGIQFFLAFAYTDIEDSGNDFEAIRSYMQILLYMLDFEELRIVQSVKKFHECDKESLVKSLWLNYGTEVKTAQLICNLCLDYNLFDITLWDNALNRLVKLQSTCYLAGIIEQISNVSELSSIPSLPKVWNQTIKLCLKNSLDNSDPALYLRAVELIQKCPFSDELDTEDLAGLISQLSTDSDGANSSLIWKLKGLSALLPNPFVSKHIDELIVSCSIPEIQIVLDCFTDAHCEVLLNYAMIATFSRIQMREEYLSYKLNNYCRWRFLKFLVDINEANHLVIILREKGFCKEADVVEKFLKEANP
ncbi:hypothetical protein HDU82_000937 [Entophlyctis luteolus]|nr:hypothetical protein HDU82_000928 [Entophlyctis luteolus]KAJ3212515.1 hypothetical protein HDU82_000937 [Entophlyctis luteolus]